MEGYVECLGADNEGGGSGTLEHAVNRPLCRGLTQQNISY